MISSTLLMSVLLTQVPESEPLPPQMGFPPNEKTLVEVLTVGFPRPVLREPSRNVGPVFALYPSVTPPRVISSPQPNSPSEPTRKIKRTGVVVVSAIVGTDGKVRGARVVRSLGKEWDEKAVAAIKTWVFQPATKDGRPVAVAINIEVTFHLYE